MNDDNKIQLVVIGWQLEMHLHHKRHHIILELGVSSKTSLWKKSLRWNINIILVNQLFLPAKLGWAAMKCQQNTESFCIFRRKELCEERWSLWSSFAVLGWKSGYAKQQLKCLKRRLLRDKRFFQDYKNFKIDVLIKGYAKRSDMSPLRKTGTFHIMVSPTQASQEKNVSYLTLVQNSREYSCVLLSSIL